MNTGLLIFQVIAGGLGGLAFILLTAPFAAKYIKLINAKKEREAGR